MSLRVIDNPGSIEISRSFSTFKKLIGIVEKFLMKQKYLQAAVAAQIAAFYAAYNHHGGFVSTKLEGMLRAIGNIAIKERLRWDFSSRSDGEVRHVLHILTAARDVGGDGRFVWRFIRRDAVGRSHSVALTNQLNNELPQDLIEAVKHTGGTCHVLDEEYDNFIDRARALRRISEKADVIFLHLYPEDVVPLIAFSDKTNAPPIVFFNHADHQFWLGVSIADLFVNLRESGIPHSKERRGIERERMALLPIPLDPLQSPNSRFQAKKKIGFCEDTVVLLSIARAVKYMAFSGPSFAETATSVLQEHKNAVLVVIGPDNVGQWKIGHERTGGRIIALGRRGDTRGFYEAADIYLDSFPFSSNTSLLEAGSYSLPLVSYFPYSKAAEVMGAGAPGLERTIFRAATLDDYERLLSRLIKDKGLREEVGERTNQEILSMHSGKGWSRFVRELYQRISVTLPVIEWSGVVHQNRAGELDLLLNRFYSKTVPLGWVIDLYASRLPYSLRLEILGEMLKVDRSFSFSMFLPGRVAELVAGRIKGWRKLPLMDRLYSVRE